MTEKIIGKLKPIFYVIFSAVVFFSVTVFIFSMLILFNKVEEARNQTLLNQAEIHFNNERMDKLLRNDTIKMNIVKENNELLKQLINKK